MLGVGERRGWECGLDEPSNREALNSNPSATTTINNNNI
jgi:hypothetical protein